MKVFVEKAERQREKRRWQIDISRGCVLGGGKKWMSRWQYLKMSLETSLMIILRCALR
jgi:hypothetical protein